MQEEDADTEQSGFPIPKLKSILAVFVGLFCILCFKKLIVFGRRWKNIITDWGYRSLNVPSLWSSDAFVQGNAVDSSSSSNNFTWTGVRNGNFFKRVPALRLPDAWPNFLLTWLCLNFDTMSSLIPTWTAAINEELIKLCTRGAINRGKDVSLSNTKQLQLKSVQKSSVPPRLSAIETSASGSTKELHFHCTFSSPDVTVQVTLMRPKTSSEKDSSSPESYLVQMQQLSCRVQIICAALEGDYVLLSWKMVSPLLVQRLSLLTLNREPVSTLAPSEIRWIKDYLYLSIQSAVVRVVLNPFHLTPVQQPFPTESFHEAKTLEKYLHHGQINGPSFNSTKTHAPIGDAIHLRVVYAILLEPTELRPMDPLLRLPLRCEIHGNPIRLSSRTDQSSLDASPETVLLSTDGVYLKPKPMPGDQSRQGKTFLNGKLQTTNASSYVAVWNQDALVPIDKLTSDLLDVVLCTETTPSLTPPVHLHGHAVLPLPTYGENPSKSQHVLLVDCHAGEPTDKWTPRTKMLGDVRAKFMLILHAELFASSPTTTDLQDKQDVVPAARVHRVFHLAPSPPPVRAATGVKRWQSERKMPAKDAAAIAKTRSAQTPPAPPCPALSTEQLAQFMSAPSELWPLPGGGALSTAYLERQQETSSQRSRSRSFGDQPKVKMPNPDLSIEATEIHASEHVSPQPQTSHDLSDLTAKQPPSYLTFAHTGTHTSSDPSQTSLFQITDSDTLSKASGKRKLFSLKRFRSSRGQKPKLFHSGDFERLATEDAVDRQSSPETNEFRKEIDDQANRSKLRRFLDRHSFRRKRHPDLSPVRRKSLLDRPTQF